MGHSWQRVPSTPVMKTPLYHLSHLFKVLSNLSFRCFQLPPLLFLMSCFFDWMGERALFNYSLVEVAYLFTRCNRTTFFLWNTNNTDRNGVNKQKTHTKHLEQDNIGGGDGSNYEPGCFWISVFWQCKRSKWWRQLFFELEIYQEA